ncbi:MAG: hypothetical protein BECKG1743D_GA0114223_102952 [Candidatus Kentron sp. G]|nr:MAG: hypothetical protein BECKG1743D_GA0114223_102952 [Candidatus Kentron sp. G]
MSIRRPTGNKVISVREHTSLLVLLPSFLRCNDGYMFTMRLSARS